MEVVYLAIWRYLASLLNEYSKMSVGSNLLLKKKGTIKI